jgi:mRNA interferase RelE/StbE
MMRLVFNHGARRSFRRLPSDRLRQIVEHLEALAAHPDSRRLDVEPLTGSDLFRLRVGSYRVLFSMDEVRRVLTVELI